MIYRRTDTNDIIVNFFTSLGTPHHRFNVAVCLLNNRSQKMPKCGDHENAQIFLFLPHFDLFCDLLLNRCTATWNLFVKYTYSICKCVCLQSCMIFVYMKEYKNN